MIRPLLLASAIAAITLPAAAGSAIDPFQPNESERAQLAVLDHPNSYFVERLKGPRENKDGVLLHPKVQFFLETIARPADTPESTREEAAQFATPKGRAEIRAWVDRNWAFKTQASAPMASVDDLRIPGRDGEIPVRVYRPALEQPAALPVLVYFHGGGWLFGSIEAVDRAVRLIANEARVVVVSVDYRLAPEHVYPAAHNDAEDAYRWVKANAASLGGDPALVGVGGDSAGGNLAISVSVRQLAAGRPVPTYQLLYYPVTDTRRNTRSFGLFASGYGLDAMFIDEMVATVFPDAKTHAFAEVSPLRAKSLQGLPATMLVAAGYDVLRDQGRAFARRLEQSGVSVVYLNYSGLGHGFMQRSAVYDEAERATLHTAQVFGQAIRSRPAMLGAR